MRKLLVALLVLLAVLFTSCADVVTITEIAETDPHIYGFWGGVWHGIVLHFAFVGRLFSDDIAIYAVANNGAWYDFGFVGGFWLMLRVGLNFLKILYK